VIRTLRRLCTRCLAALGLFLLVVTFTPVVKLAASAIAQDWFDGNGEVLVVLGGSMLVSGTSSNATLGEDTYLRCIYASWILKTQHYHHVVVTGGEGMAQAMAALLAHHGVPPGSILTENAAMSTYQNALYTKLILERQYGWGYVPQVTVLTSDYHSWRARRTFEHCGMHVNTIPIPDVIKRSGYLPFRWTGAMTLLDEFLKDAYYVATGRIDV
jgi:uncharacterized SAM-binding protein YcdF (DUF218 family)